MTESETKINNADRKFCKNYIEQRFTGFSKCKIADEGSILRIKSSSEIFDESNNYSLLYCEF
jgi:hypothetical protein